MNSNIFSKSKVLLFVVFFMCIQSVMPQDYIDLFKINYTAIPSSGYENIDGDNEVNLFDVGFTYPVKLNDKIAIITGVGYIQQTLELSPNTCLLYTSPSPRDS